VYGYGVGELVVHEEFREGDEVFSTSFDALETHLSEFYPLQDLQTK